MASKPQSLVALATRILESAKVIDAYLEKHDLSPLSISAGADADFPVPASEEDVHAARQAILGLSDTLTENVMGPRDLLIERSWAGHHTSSAMRAISAFELYANVPESGAVTFEEIASKTKPPLAVGFVKTVLRYAMTQGVFCEPTPNHVAHTAPSLLLLKDPLARAFVANNADEVFPAAAKAVDAMRKWPEAEAPSHTGLQLAYGTDKAMFEWYASDEGEAQGRMEKFAGSMQFWSAGEGFLAKHVVSGFDWASLPKNGLVVDVGGGPGHISIAIAEANPSLRLIVQDLPGQSEQALAEAKANQTELVSSGRLDFKPANFFAPQPDWLEAESVDVYFLRYIFHDWNDEHCVKILQTLLTSGKLKKGGRIVLAESVIPPPEAAPYVPKTVMKTIRRLDMQMLTILGSHERTLADWQELFYKADPKLKIEGVKQPEGSVCTLLAARLQD